MNTTTEVIHLYAVKGGQGTTTVAASLALLSARSGFKTALVSEGRDLSAIIGTSELDGGPNLHQLGSLPDDVTGYSLVVVDHGLRLYGLEDGGRQFLVTRGPCYLALRTAVAAGTKPDGVILLQEEGRALGKKDVEDVLGVPVVATIPVDVAVARCIDAGLLASRLPKSLAEGLGAVVNSVLAIR